MCLPLPNVRAVADLYCRYWRYVALVGPSGYTVVSGVVVVVCNRSQMRTSKCTCLIFGVSIGLDPG